MRRRFQHLPHVVLTAALCVPAACASQEGAHRSGIRVVAVEAVYGDIARQIAGNAVSVATILDSPSADPHAYEPTARDANAIAQADVVIENGLGYDAFADKLLSASPRAGRTVIVVGTLAGRHAGDNPHVWYDSEALRRLSSALVGDLTRRLPRDRASLARSNGRFRAWLDDFARRTLTLGRRYRGTPVAITEPVFDAVLQAASLRIVTPRSFSKAIENGNDPAPQDVATMRALLAGRHVAALVYNRQTVEPSTTQLLAVAQTSGVPVVAVSETLPSNRHVQGWFDGELAALTTALEAAQTPRHEATYAGKAAARYGAATVREPSGRRRIPEFARHHGAQRPA
ncbi:MAG: zinc ABC transporter substrate-binding protein [Candidatus Eremiobacteraeota bacterium]|nr:zinc ABC transporter substrate-binding protein [Candidatus Eremiobacteraeota bacterium]